ncbi:MAG: hypothetical protein V1898_01525 [Patescibacteria group bacterium]
MGIEKTLRTGLAAALLSSAPDVLAGRIDTNEATIHAEKKEFMDAYNGAIVNEPGATQMFIDLANTYWYSDLLDSNEAKNFCVCILEVAENNNKAYDALKLIISDSNFALNLHATTAEETKSLRLRLGLLLANK